MGASVGSRRGPDRRTKDQKEWYCLRRYLLTLAAHELLIYPLNISKSERPDFLVDAPRDRYGIEVTEATEEDWQRELTESEDARNDGLPNVARISEEGFAGEQPERVWCATVIRAINSKIDSLNDPSYPVVSCDLLVYVNSRMTLVVGEARAFELLSEAIPPEMERWKACDRLGCVAILTNWHVLPDLLKGVAVLRVVDS